MNPRKHYSDELKHEIIALAMAGQSVASLARQFEPTSATIHAWIRKAREDGELDPKLSDKVRFKELEARYKQLQRDYAILKKATAFFAAESTPTLV